MDIKGIDPAVLLMNLHAATRALGLGVFQDGGPISLARARELVASMPKRNGVQWFDYVEGRPIKVGFGDDGVLYRADLFDRDAPGGDGSCARAVAAAQAWGK